MIMLAVLVALLAQVQAPAPAPRAPADLASQAPRPKVARGDEMVCHPGAATGRILGPPMCRTRDQWDAMVRTATAGMDHGAPNSCRAGMMNGC